MATYGDSGVYHCNDDRKIAKLSKSIQNLEQMMNKFEDAIDKNLQILIVVNGNRFNEFKTQ